MRFSSLSNEELHLQTIQAAKSEKRATLHLLECLHLLDERRLYAERGYPSLWMYVHKELGYSEGQTSERVGAMRLMVKIPEVKKSLEENKLTLTSAAKLASFVRKEKVEVERTLTLLTQVEEKSSREVERLLLQGQKTTGAKPDQLKISGPSLTRISFDADEELMKMITRLKELQVNPGLSLGEIFKKTAKEYLVKRQLKNHADGTQGKSIKNPETRYIPARVKNAVRLRSGDRCEFVGNSEKRCESRSQLQFDHRVPYQLGGASSLENTRHLCREHNLFEAERLFGREKMKRFA